MLASKMLNDSLDNGLTAKKMVEIKQIVTNNVNDFLTPFSSKLPANV